MNLICKQFGYLATGLILIGGSSCSSYDAAAKSAENQSQPSARTRQFPHLQLTGNQLDSRSAPPEPSNSVSSVLPSTKVPESTATVTVYEVDNLCQSLKPATVTGPDNQLMSSAVNEVLKQEIFASLGLVGYRLKIDRDLGIATVDLRASGNSRQKLQNLSSCQMLGLFGGVRQTLTSYAPWQIKTVRFTELGQDIVSTVRE
ncbi:MAG: hypothetical protein JGK24_11370 [Microcoleus sp. PH2017_29_MFU_D_A]|uniref:hypothetical protein n=1 Tax=unclassified Microcoleus TaxID=2642155 RepID=UPI001DB23EC0|nr:MULTISPECIES: hypothetical protein [unclassified Microcoleus]MCC3419529.1 hypothetical protein [Microcoleus sp. PH2017_07_MST_O_A]MCC3428910.1 hypothetical protein [Microcoleus sp. PH2017_04_SCI_O_A]MCC3441174.1 hypothetical protein [Microcoleus sp. PH2017_03_ELD_O_A]MCC3464596.1 hypothetical protein [Microcoleus sp. PH2017_06_SFM_O_A]MCC3503651.1 hypothetical protein [Microcoleus sp. PH2017_19_SFW_U_A]MCC3511412.1 hypothetical protein [Microcoleus sp. PH2017_17_BER_D_A]TAE09911.1 MAG: hy